MQLEHHGWPLAATATATCSLQGACGMFVAHVHVETFRRYKAVEGVAAVRSVCLLCGASSSSRMPGEHGQQHGLRHQWCHCGCWVV